MGASPRCLLLPFCVMVMMAITIADASSGHAGSILFGQANLGKCANRNRKNKMAPTAFKGLKVVIKCKNSNGEYESKAMGKLDGSGAFAVPLAANLHRSDCFTQLHNAAGLPCPGQEPSSIVPMDDGTFNVVAGKVQFPLAECASTTISHDHMKHLSEHFHKNHGHDNFFDHFHKDHDHHHFFDHFHKPPAMPEYHPPTPTYGSPTPIYHPPTQH